MVQQIAHDKGLTVHLFEVGQGEVRIKMGQKVELEKQKTSMGEGYALRLILEKDQYYYSLADEENIYPENIFQKDNMMYWFSDGLKGGNLRDENGSIILLPSTDKSK